ncbi:MAG: AraC family transcriptional regulator [Clostridia bacterium]|nr:AraC family transcriptional regulator [Clostridia bacterium]
MAQERFWDYNRQMPEGRDFEAYHFVGTKPHPVVYHSHPYFEVFFFLSGHTRIVVDTLDFEPARGDVLIYPPGVMHRNIHLDAEVPYERFYLYATRAYLTSVSTVDYDIPGTLDRMTQNEHYRFHIGQEDLDPLIPEIDAIIEDSNHLKPQDKIINCYRFCTFLIRSLGMMTSLEVVPQSDFSRGMSRLISYINLHFSESLSLDDLADEFHMSKYHLLREFKNYTGISVHQYLMIRRILVSQEMIRHGAKPKDACILCGFTDYSSYYRAFRSRTGMSPEQYRQSILA